MPRARFRALEEPVFYSRSAWGMAIPDTRIPFDQMHSLRLKDADKSHDGWVVGLGCGNGAFSRTKTC